ncbi:PREDICTED: cuticle protein 16.5-like [Rhagoletis zephyria]|uniref:cuticle protein 16.5-like n=1 Tax=Rhagoletis zephyria TaxID=28612 RepID=UPI00081155BF|nr:PREDICTED: cuticle protein 16.5-like [Rhagoletis zephyria]
MNTIFRGNITFVWFLHSKLLLLACALVAYVTADVSHLSNEYLPPNYGASSPSYSVAASAPAPSYSAPAPSYSVAASAPAPSVSYAEPEYAASEPAPAHSFSSSDGYRYKTQRRVVYRHRRRRDALSSEYLPPAASSPSVEYLPPAASAPAPSYSVSPSVSYAPAPSYQSESYAPAASSYSASFAEPSYAESAPAHSFSSDDGYRYKTARRRVYRRRRY